LVTTLGASFCFVLSPPLAHTYQHLIETINIATLRDRHELINDGHSWIILLRLQ
jgi:hypothetical protein